MLPEQPTRLEFIETLKELLEYFKDDIDTAVQVEATIKRFETMSEMAYNFEMYWGYPIDRFKKLKG